MKAKERFNALLSRSKTKKDYWQERCKLIEAENEALTAEKERAIDVAIRQRERWKKAKQEVKDLTAEAKRLRGLLKEARQWMDCEDPRHDEEFELLESKIIEELKAIG